MTRSRLPLLAALALVLLPVGASAQTALTAVAGESSRIALTQQVEGGVLDNAQMFKPETVAAAREKIQQIRKEYNCAILIDTVTKAPTTGWPKANSWSVRTRESYFQGWAKERSQELGVEGIHVLICKQPRHVAVVVWPERFEAEFGPKDRTGIERLLIRKLVSAPDDGLLSVLDQIRTDLQAHQEPEPPSVPLAPLLIFIGGTIGAWLVLVVVRWRLQKPEPFSFTGEPQTLRLNAGLLAGMFGNPCNYWITDRLFPQTVTSSTPDVVFEDAPPATEPAVLSEESPEGPPTAVMESMPEHMEIEHD